MRIDKWLAINLLLHGDRKATVRCRVAPNKYRQFARDEALSRLLTGRYEAKGSRNRVKALIQVVPDPAPPRWEPCFRNSEGPALQAGRATGNYEFFG
jgi:hypothetical protein